MSPLVNRLVLLGVTGGIAAVRAPELVRRLREAGAEVQVVLTRAARAFVTPTALAALSGRPVRTGLFDAAEATLPHIELARRADLLLVAPATAHALARLAAGLADDLLGTLYLATRAPVCVAPAMNTAMWEHPATQANVARLRAAGVHVIEPAAGRLACGETGPGRLPEPETLVAEAAALLAPPRLAGRRVLVTAGPTREPLDPVRFLGNRSSGRMGFALAEAARQAGAEVTLVTGPTALATPPGVQRVDVETALEMREAVLRHLPGTDLFIAAAAVADYRPRTRSVHKLKKTDETLSLELVRNPDILAEVAALPERPFTVGFAAETEALEARAQAKRRAKGVDMICANLVGPGRGMETETNALTLFWEGGREDFPERDKKALAHALIEAIARRLDSATEEKAP
ncbi:MAG: bifunctional phosphopantothenoylcysteine decarboxylase/phosphopantothenate--cysteine ligase CoaBC [Gammaproteobacteria bacterium]|nr:MAG: bifunctional phosphopantothenoylcysteine decarboxylase/phosphopantothenate--cysteine ligase CoaBC [Gammaproteobacteria bacterium]